MILSLILVCCLTVVIHLIGIVSLSAKIVGINTKRIATSASIFNIVVLISQFANTIQAPLLTKSIESDIVLGKEPNEIVFRSIIFAATIGTVLGAFFIPTVHRFMQKGVQALYSYHSIFTVVMKSLRWSTLVYFKNCCTLPNKTNFYRLSRYKDLYIELILLNVLVYAFITVSVLACLYAGFLNPNLRTTALSMSGVAVSVGAVGMMIFIEPYHATLTDKVIEGTVSEAFFRRHLTFVIIARITGTIMSQFLLVPLAQLIIFFAELL